MVVGGFRQDDGGIPLGAVPHGEEEVEMSVAVFCVDDDFFSS